MVGSFISESSDLASDSIEASQSSSTVSMVFQIPSTPSAGSLTLPRLYRPRSSAAELVGYSFTKDGVHYTIREKSASKKGASKPSWIWRHGSELESSRRHPGWLCHRCWDKGVISMASAANTTRAIQHLSDTHRISSDGVIEEDSSIQSSTPSVLDLQIQGARSSRRLNQSTVDIFLHILIHWIVIAHIALSCVEQSTFQELIQLLNP